MNTATSKLSVSSKRYYCYIYTRVLKPGCIFRLHATLLVCIGLLRFTSSVSPANVLADYGWLLLCIRQTKRMPCSFDGLTKAANEHVSQKYSTRLQKIYPPETRWYGGFFTCHGRSPPGFQDMKFAKAQPVNKAWFLCLFHGMLRISSQEINIVIRILYVVIQTA